MRRRIEALADQIEELVSEDGHDALVITCAPEATGLVGAAADLVAQRGGIDPTFALLDTFESADALADRVVAWVQTIDGARRDAALGGTARERMLAALAALACTLSARTARVVLLVCPSAVADEGAYVDAVVALARASRTTASPLRIVMREVGHGRVRAALAAERRPTLVGSLDTSPTAVRESLIEEARDTANDPAARAAALLQVAMTDAGTGRAEEAIPVLVALSRHFAAIGDASTRAIAVLGIGSALWQLGRLEDARAAIGTALAIAMKANVPAIVLSGAMLAGHLAMRCGDGADADARFDVAARLAAHLGSPHAVTEALFERGGALEARGLPGEAFAVWIRAATVARLVGAPERERTSLERALRVRAEHAIDADSAPYEQRLQELAHGAGEGCHHGHAP